MSRHVYLIAGEASGDFLGAQLIKALKIKEPDIHFSGIGGPLMQAEGLKSLFPMHELSLMGIWEIAPKVFSILKRIRQTVHDIIDKQPDIVVTIDAPDFSFRVIKGVQRGTSVLPKIIHYVAPTVWAWRPKRAQKIAQFLDGLICLFDFEPRYFKREGLPAVSVGHPMMESGIQEATAAIIGDDRVQNLGVFLGSRHSELKHVGPVIIESVRKIADASENIELIVPTLPHLEEKVKELILPLDLPCTIVTDQKDKWSVFKACDAAIAVSGTVGLELAAAGVPHIIAYKANPLTAMIIRRVIRTPFVHLANIIAGEEIVPEFLQEECVPDDIANEVLALLSDEELRQKQKEQFVSIRERIGGDNPPSQAAAEFLLAA